MSTSLKSSIIRWVIIYGFVPVKHQGSTRISDATLWLTLNEQSLHYRKKAKSNQVSDCQCVFYFSERATSVKTKCVAVDFSLPGMEIYGKIKKELATLDVGVLGESGILIIRKVGCMAF